MKKVRSRRNILEVTGRAEAVSVAIASGVSVAVFLFAPTGIAALLVAVGLRSPPFIVQAAPAILAFCALMGVLAALIRFFMWLVGRPRHAGRKTSQNGD